MRIITAEEINLQIVKRKKRERETELLIIISRQRKKEIEHNQNVRKLEGRP